MKNFTTEEQKRLSSSVRRDVIETSCLNDCGLKNSVNKESRRFGLNDLRGRSRPKLQIPLFHNKYNYFEQSECT